MIGHLLINYEMYVEYMWLLSLNNLNLYNETFKMKPLLLEFYITPSSFFLSLAVCLNFLLQK